MGGVIYRLRYNDRMKTKPLTFLLSLTFLFLFSCDKGIEVQREYWDDEKRNLKFEISYKNKKHHGTWTSWYENGELKSVSLYDNGELVKFAEYTEDGTKRIDRLGSKDIYRDMTQISETQTNLTCGKIKYSILNEGYNERTGRDDIIINIFNRNGEVVLNTDSVFTMYLTCKDVTGNGSPEFIFDTWGGGKCGCCNDFYVITDNQTGEKPKIEILYKGIGFSGIYFDQKRSLHEIDECSFLAYGKYKYTSETLCLDSREDVCKETRYQKWK